MGLFGKLFEKKVCDICGGEIRLMGNRKLDDGNLCKECAAKLSPWFSDRRSSTVEQIREQLDDREANREKVAAFHTTKTLGSYTKLLVDEDKRQFMVTSARNLAEANPDVIDFADVTGCRLDINESKRELKEKDADGKDVSFDPPRYEYSYDQYIIINVNNRWFDEMKFKLNSSTIKVTPPAQRKGLAGTALSFARNNIDFRECEAMGNEIVALLTGAREKVREEAAPKAPVICPYCGANTIPNEKGCCEYCGGSVK